MRKINWDKISPLLADTEVSATVAEFVLVAHRFPLDIKIAIREYPNGKYQGFSDVSYWGPRQTSPHKTAHFTDTLESALIDWMGDMERFPEAKDGQRYVFCVRDDPSDPTKWLYFDGTGTQVTLSEVEKRRTEWHKNPAS